MDALTKLSREAQVVLGATLLFVIISFFDWQQYSSSFITVGVTLWHGFGTLTAIVALILLGWEIARAFGVQINTGAFTSGQISAVLALLLVIFTVIVFLDWSQFRHWPEWLGLILSIVIAAAAFRRARLEGVEIPRSMPSMGAGRSGGAAAATAPAAGAEGDSPSGPAVADGTAAAAPPAATPVAREPAAAAAEETHDHDDHEGHDHGEPDEEGNAGGDEPVGESGEGPQA
jgi:hypothetical protein